MEMGHLGCMLSTYNMHFISYTVLFVKLTFRLPVCTLTTSSLRHTPFVAWVLK